MKIGPAMLFVGAWLLAPTVVCADGVACPGSAEGFRNSVNPIQSIDGQAPGTRAHADGKAGICFSVKNDFQVVSPEPLLNSEMIVGPPAGIYARASDLNLFDFLNQPLSRARFDRGSPRSKPAHEGVKVGTTNLPGVSVSEPGSLARSLVGLIGIGLLVRRSGIVRDTRITYPIFKSKQSGIPIVRSSGRIPRRSWVDPEFTECRDT
jgi:hypothetical protein